MDIAGEGVEMAAKGEGKRMANFLCLLWLGRVRGSEGGGVGLAKSPWEGRRVVARTAD